MAKRKNMVTITYADGRVEVVSPSKIKPRSRRAQLAAFRRTPHWRKIRRAALERAKGRCEACRGRSKCYVLECHHLTYDRLGEELLEDVVILCQRCHATEHQWQRRRAA